MSNYRPEIENPIPLKLLVPEYENKYGVENKKYPSIENGILFFGSFKTYGGTEKTVNGIYSIEDTAKIKCIYRPDIKSDCRIVLPQTNAVYEILGEPENINMRNQFLEFKVRRIKGQA